MFTTPDTICPRCNQPSKWSGEECRLCGEVSPINGWRLTPEAQAELDKEQAEYSAIADEVDRDFPTIRLRCISIRGHKGWLTLGKVYRQQGVQGMRRGGGALNPIILVLDDKGAVNSYSKSMFEVCQAPSAIPVQMVNLTGFP